MVVRREINLKFKNTTENTQFSDRNKNGPLTIGPQQCSAGENIKTKQIQWEMLVKIKRKRSEIEKIRKHVYLIPGIIKQKHGLGKSTWELWKTENIE